MEKYLKYKKRFLKLSGGANNVTECRIVTKNSQDQTQNTTICHIILPYPTDLEEDDTQRIFTSSNNPNYRKIKSENLGSIKQEIENSCNSNNLLIFCSLLNEQKYKQLIYEKKQTSLKVKTENFGSKASIKS